MGAAEGDRRSSEGRVDVGIIQNDDKQDENMTIKEDNDKDDNDTSIYNITKKKKNEMLVRVNSSWC